VSDWGGVAGKGPMPAVVQPLFSCQGFSLGAVNDGRAKPFSPSRETRFNDGIFCVDKSCSDEYSESGDESTALSRVCSCSQKKLPLTAALVVSRRQAAEPPPKWR
jgi:hypothetical protein